MAPRHPWFLDASERGNDATSLARRAPWTEGNEVIPLIDGKGYFECLAQTLSRLGPEDRVWLLDWRGDDDERLTDDGPDLATALIELARRGVDVRGLLWRAHPSWVGFHEESQTELAALVNEAGGQLVLDQRVRRAGSHHQKLVVVQRGADPDANLAFVGGIDLCHGRRDDGHHMGDPQAEHLDPRYGDRAPWHDTQAQVRGPAVADLIETFRERWNDRTPVEQLASPLGRLRARFARHPLIPEPIDDVDATPRAVGTHDVQVLRTYPVKRPPYPFAPEGERSIARFYQKALSKARSLLYIEDQYFWSKEVGQTLAAALKASPDLRVIVVVPRFPDRDGPVTGPPHRVGQRTTLDRVRDAGGDRVAVYDLENEIGTPIYVHAKVVVVDDEIALMGSDNMNRRSWTHDSELSIAVFDQERDPREPLDPAGRGEGARRFARDLRLRLAREHLQVDDDATLLDPIETFERWRASAKVLDAWHAGGEEGPRPPGRVREHRPEPVAPWQWLFAAPLYRLVVDPDGRRFTKRRSHHF